MTKQTASFEILSFERSSLGNIQNYNTSCSLTLDNMILPSLPLDLSWGGQMQSDRVGRVGGVGGGGRVEQNWDRLVRCPIMEDDCDTYF